MKISIILLFGFLIFAPQLFAQRQLELPDGTTIDADQTPDPKPTVITKIDLEKRLEELKQAQSQVSANLQAIGGAIQQVEYFLKEIEAREQAIKEKEKQPNEHQ
jgi:hypothetical protein